MINGVANAALAVEPKYNAARVTLYPNEGDWFDIALETGNLTAVAAGGVLFMMRNLTTKTLRLSRLIVRMWVFTAFTAAQELGIQIFRASGVGTSDTGGTNITAIPRLGLPAQNASIFAVSTNGLMNISTTGALTAGTRTLDTNPIYVKSGFLNTVGALIIDEAIDFNENGTDCPGLFAQNEGIEIVNKVLMGAAGLVRLQIRARWDEL